MSSVPKLLNQARHYCPKVQRSSHIPVTSSLLPTDRRYNHREILVINSFIKSYVMPNGVLTCDLFQHQVNVRLTGKVIVYTLLSNSNEMTMNTHVDPNR